MPEAQYSCLFCFQAIQFLTMGLRSEALTANEMLGLTSNLAKYCLQYFRDLDRADSEGITEYPGRSNRLSGIYKYSGIENMSMETSRLVGSGSCIAILPPKPTMEERKLMGELVLQQDEVVRQYSETYSLLVGDLPITTLCFRSHADIEQICALGTTGVSPWAGNISLNYAMLWDTFNLEAANWVTKQYGVNIGAKAVIFNHIHESGHQLIEQHRKKICHNKGVPDWKYAGSFRRLFWKARVAWEMSANELVFSASDAIKVEGERVYPDYFASRNDSLKSNDFIGKALVENYYDNRPVMRELTYPSSEYQQPFVVDPSDAALWLSIAEQPIPGSFSSWTGYLLNLIEVNPLVG